MIIRAGIVAALALGLAACGGNSEPSEDTAETATPAAEVVATVAKSGEDIYKKCVACHTITKDGPQKGPYLGEVAKQYGRAELIESIVKPNDKMSQGFTTRWFEMKDGQRLMGFVTSEGAETIELRNTFGQVMQIKAADIVKRGEDKNSMMPPGLVNNHKPEELATLSAYFESLVGK